MAFNPDPTGYFPGVDTEAVVSGETGVFIPYSDLEGYDVTNKDDIRQLMYAILDAATEAYSDLTTANKSTEMTLRKSQSSPSNDVLRISFNSTINVSLSGIEFDVPWESGV